MKRFEAKERKVDLDELNEKRLHARNTAYKMQEEREKNIQESAEKRQKKNHDIMTSGNSYNDQQQKVRKQMKELKLEEQTSNKKTLEQLQAQRKTDLMIKGLMQRKGLEASKV